MTQAPVLRPIPAARGIPARRHFPPPVFHRPPDISRSLRHVAGLSGIPAEPLTSLSRPNQSQPTGPEKSASRQGNAAPWRSRLGVSIRHGLEYEQIAGKNGHLSRLGQVLKPGECGSRRVWKGTPGGIRTPNRRIRNPLLYPLSYGRRSAMHRTRRYDLATRAPLFHAPRSSRARPQLPNRFRESAKRNLSGKAELQAIGKSTNRFFRGQSTR